MDQTAPVLIFDGDCGFCTTSALWAQRHLLPRDGRAVSVSPWQRTDLAALGVEPARPQQEVVWVGPNGEQRGGAAAAAALLRYRGGGLRIVGTAMDLPLVRTVLAAVYRLIARHRHQLPGGTPACAMPPR